MKSLTLRRYSQKQAGMLLILSGSLFALALLFMPNQALALACRANTIEGSAEDRQIIPEMRLPHILSPGAVIWRSPQYSKTAVCYKDWVDTNSEYVHMYLNPGLNRGSRNPAVFSDNLLFGININGQDYPLQSGETTKVNLGVQIPGCSRSMMSPAECKRESARTFNYSYYLYIKKGGDTPESGKYSGSSELTYFQLDGAGGLSNAQDNYNLRVTGLDKISYTTCYANASFNPGSVDLGSIIVPLGGVSAGARADKISKQFSLNVNITCAEPLGVDTYFDSTENVSSDGYTLELSNGLDLKLKEVNPSGNYVKFRDVTTGFIQKNQNISTKTQSYETELYWRTNDPVPGPFNTSVTVTLFYN